MLTPEVLCEADYRRTHGVHEFETRDGMAVTVLSAPTWEEFDDQLSSLPETDGYIVSPELITSPVRLELIPLMRRAIQARDYKVANASIAHPWARVLLGTVDFSHEKPRNVAQAYFVGRRSGQQVKMNPAWDEGEIFDLDIQAKEPKTAFAIAAHGLLLCSDLIGAAVVARLRQESARGEERAKRFIARDIRSLIVMSCWGVPTTPSDAADIKFFEQRAQTVLENAVKGIFSGYPHLEEIILADRAIPETGLQPFNAHFRRV